MNTSNSELWDKIRNQFDSAPYPNYALDKSPKEEYKYLYIHSLVTAYYLRNQKVIDTKDKIILDAGCGSGYKSLTLAEANPGAKIVGIDISEESVKLAQKRLEYHGFDNAEFYTLSIYDLPQLNYQFDYINCDETLYFFPDIALALTAMKDVLKPEGIIRSNIHSSLQRFGHFRAQKVFSMMGLMDENPGDMEIELVHEIMNSLQENTEIKTKVWNPNKSSSKGKDDQQRILMNYLLQGDKGFNINDMFSAFRTADLEFIKMVNWRQWDLMNLFKEPDNLPAFLGMSLPEASIEEQLQLFELLHPIHRLLDFLCGHPQAGNTFIPIDEWTNTEWENATVHLHPQFNNPIVITNVIACVSEGKTFPIRKDLAVTEDFVYVDSSMALCLFFLLETSLPMMSLVEKWQQFRPLDPLSGEPIEKVKVFQLLQKLLLVLESFDVIMLETKSSL
ncbi:class I SAM-dependent methyltransferase [Okeanomitos corallinicola TIOX110]|uniref:Class I SAM-dependent methyltransferase n=1 Tax=Okeanomitos corallinicola TIOX110 TaxID=3133117 RepID=A0ABZ2UZY9_9CYAN